MPRHQKPVPGEGEEQQLVPVGGGKEKKKQAEEKHRIINKGSILNYSTKD